MKACTPANSLAQLTWARNMIRHNVTGTEARQAFASCAGIPKGRQKAFENDALNDAKTAAFARAHGNKQAIPDLLEVTLPKLVVTYRGQG